MNSYAGNSFRCSVLAPLTNPALLTLSATLLAMHCHPGMPPLRLENIAVDNFNFGPPRG